MPKDTYPLRTVVSKRLARQALALAKRREMTRSELLRQLLVRELDAEDARNGTKP